MAVWQPAGVVLFRLPCGHTRNLLRHQCFEKEWPYVWWPTMRSGIVLVAADLHKSMMYSSKFCNT